jgi:hypothetical protein
LPSWYGRAAASPACIPSPPRRSTGCSAARPPPWPCREGIQPLRREAAKVPGRPIPARFPSLRFHSDRGHPDLHVLVSAGPSAHLPVCTAVCRAGARPACH